MKLMHFMKYQLPKMRAISQNHTRISYRRRCYHLCKHIVPIPISLSFVIQLIRPTTEKTKLVIERNDYLTTNRF